MAFKEEILIDITIDDADNDKQVENLTKQITALKGETAELVKQNNELIKTGKTNSKEFLDNTKQVEINKQKISENTASRKGLISTLIAEDKSVTALQVRNRELIRLRNQITTSTDEGRSAISRLNKEIDKNNSIIKANVSQMEKQRMNIGNYASALDNLIPGTGGVIQKVDSLKESFIALANPVGIAITAFATLAKLYISSTVGAKDLAKAQDTLTSAFEVSSEVVGSFINQLTGGDAGGPGPLERFVDAVLFKISPALGTLSDMAAEAKNRIRELEISAKFAQQFAKDDERRAELQRRIRDDETKSIKERIRASELVRGIMEASGERTVVVLQAQIQAIKESTANYNNNREAQLKVAELEAEIADKREEINGKLTENEKAIAALRQKLLDDYIKKLHEVEAAREDELKRGNEFLEELRKIDGSKFEDHLDEDLKALSEFHRKQFEMEEEANAKKDVLYGKDVENQVEKIKQKEIADLESKRVIQDVTNQLYQSGLNFLQAKNNEELNAVRETEQKKLEAVQERLRKGLISEDQAKKEIDAIEKESQKNQTEIKKKAFEQNKKIQITETLVNTYQSAVAAYKALVGIPYVGPVLAAIAAAAATAFGLSKVQLIRSQEFEGFALGGLIKKISGFAGGGLSGTRIGANHGTPINRSNGDNRLATVRTGEVILNERQQAALGGASTFRRIGVPGFATGGFTGSLATADAFRVSGQQNDIRALVSEVNKIRTVLVLQDFDAANAARNEPINRAQVV